MKTRAETWRWAAEDSTGRRVGVWVGGLLVVLLVAACGSSDGTLGKYEDDVQRLKQRIAEDPSDAAALRDLGEIYLRTDRPSQAYGTLKDAYARAPSDPETLFYLGLASESVGKRRAARKLFSRFTDVPDTSPYRTLMMGRYVWLVRQQTREDLRERLAQDRRISQRDVAPTTVAVLPLACEGDAYDDADRTALGRGIAEELIADLARIRGVRPVDRVRVQTLLDELSPPRSAYEYPSTAPQIGPILGAGHVVGGTCGLGRDSVHVDLRLARVVGDARETGTRETGTPDEGGAGLARQSGAMQDLFQMEGALAVAVAQALGVVVTEREKAAVASVPTTKMDAFLAYSRGLVAEDRGDFGAAVEHYRRAHRLAPDYRAPARRTERAEGLQAASGPPRSALEAARQPTSALYLTPSRDDATP